MLRNLFKTRPEKQLGRALYDTCLRASRQPVLYRDFGVPDTIEGRMELVMLHVALAIIELKASGAEEGEQLAQEVFDAMFDDFDAAMRELGVGDSGVGKKIRFMAEGFYGRASAYSSALKGEGEESLATILARNVYASDAVDEEQTQLAAYVSASAARLSAQGYSGMQQSAGAEFEVAGGQS